MNRTTSQSNPRHAAHAPQPAEKSAQAPAGDAREQYENSQAGTEQKSVIRNTGLMAMGTLLSRVTGLLRTWAMAFALGNSMLTSSYQVANNLPNVVYELVAGGFLATAFLPVLILQKERYGREGANRYTSNILNITLIVLGVLSVLCSIFAPQVVATQTFTVGSTSEVSQTTVEFFRVFAYQIVLYGLGAIITGVLNSERSFLLTSLAPGLNNIVVIVSFMLYVFISPGDPDFAILVLAVGATLGVAVQFFIQIPAVVKIGFKWEPYLNLRDPSIRETLKIALPTVLYIVANIVAVSCRNAFSLSAADNGPSVLAYAWMWFQLPYGIVAVSLSSTMFTEMSDSVAKGDKTALLRQVNQGMRGTVYLIIPLAAMLFALAQPLMGLFRAGAFNEGDVAQVASVLCVWVFTLPAYSCTMYLYKAFAAQRKVLSFALANLVGVAVQVALYAVLSQKSMLGLWGMPVGDFVYYTILCTLCILLMHRYLGRLDMKGFLGMALRTLVAAVASVLVVVLVLDVLPIPATGIVWSIARIAVGGVIGLVIAFGSTKLLRVPEFNLISGIMGKLLRHR